MDNYSQYYGVSDYSGYRGNVPSFNSYYDRDSHFGRSRYHTNGFNQSNFEMSGNHRAPRPATMPSITTADFLNYLHKLMADQQAQQEMENSFKEKPMGQRMRTASISSSRSSTHSHPLPKHPQLYKTTMCETWLNGGTCRFAERCWFAHGNHELRNSCDNQKMFDTIMPSRAQQEWMGLSHSYQSASQKGGYHPAAPKVGNNRFSEAIKKQLKAGVEACLVKDDTHKRSDTMSMTPLMDALNSNNSHNLSFNDGSTWTNSDSSSSTIGSPTECLSPVRLNQFMSQPAKKAGLDICDMFAVSGFCPMGDECIFEHTTRAFV